MKLDIYVALGLSHRRKGLFVEWMYRVKCLMRFSIYLVILKWVLCMYIYVWFGCPLFGKGSFENIKSYIYIFGTWVTIFSWRVNLSSCVCALIRLQKKKTVTCLCPSNIIIQLGYIRDKKITVIVVLYKKRLYIITVYLCSGWIEKNNYR